uniref:Uncharacterized protein n=1 Tax=Physcomitrium patens TaxID=3218 RepID=A9SYY8_PHYPA|nr:hypothetical protein PHYPA_000479 [Physcomitrium patens]
MGGRHMIESRIANPSSPADWNRNCAVKLVCLESPSTTVSDNGLMASSTSSRRSLASSGPKNCCTSANAERGHTWLANLPRALDDVVKRETESRLQSEDSIMMTRLKTRNC